MSTIDDIYVIKVFSAEALAAAGTATSSSYDLGNKAHSGYFSLQYSKTGVGVVKVEYLLSNDGKTFAEPSTGVDIVSAIATGAQSDVISFRPEPARWMQIKITEDGTDTAAFTAWLAIS